MPSAFSMLLPIVLALSLFSRTVAGEPPGPLTSLQRLERAHLQAAHDARLQLAQQRQVIPNLGVYQDFRAVIHVHAEDAEHTKGTRREVLEAAKKTGVQVVMFTDHGGPKPETWRGLHDGVLFFAGEENGNTGLLRFPKFSPDGKPSTNGELRFLSHIEERYAAASDGFAGMEICNRHTDAKLDKAAEAYFRSALANQEQWSFLVENFKLYPDEFFAASRQHHPEILAKWDQEIQKKRFTGIGANDAHQNQIFRGVTFDPYPVSFRNLSTHILARELREPEIRDSLRHGHVYVAHDWLCDPAGFAFGAVNNLGLFTMGDSVPVVGGTRVIAVTPVPAHLKLFHNGTIVQEAHGTNLTLRARELGAYRLEAWLAIEGEERPWIYSNPVYLQSPWLADLAVPAADISPSVETKRDISYVEGELEDAAKHKLDLYLPKGRTNAPVFFFIHGGAWKYGDRSQYPALANRFAKEGLVIVTLSYRLAPKHSHPAQIEDVAAAFAWTARHIREYGGDPHAIFVGGHSAGGHLAALLALDEKYLKRYGLSKADIRGVIALSGVYDLILGEALSSVFGADENRRRDASPLFHVTASAPPFLISYCQWDYFTLPWQARQFHAALTKAGAKAELVYIPGESHISEMLHIPRDTDPTAKAVLTFVQSLRPNRE